MSRDQRSTLLLTLVLLAAAFGLKWWYMEATVAELGFMLKPVAYVVQAISGETYVFAPGRGYLFHGLGIAIDRSCSGINFLVITVATLSLLILKQGDGGCMRPVLALLCAAGAYVLAIAVNSGRILSMVWVRSAGFELSGRAHEAFGALIFLTGLSLAAISLHLLLTKRPSAQPS
ncbi:MAG: exosortase K [Flavobacteriales bacterium]|nr:exosortase K [Flavobacteriales bacterium]